MSLKIRSTSDWPFFISSFRAGVNNCRLSDGVFDPIEALENMLEVADDDVDVEEAENREGSLEIPDTEPGLPKIAEPVTGGVDFESEASCSFNTILISSSFDLAFNSSVGAAEVDGEETLVGSLPNMLL